MPTVPTMPTTETRMVTGVVGNVGVVGNDGVSDMKRPRRCQGTKERELHFDED
jgi:hypothetical protein